MEPRPLIADLCGQDGVPATIAFHELELATQGPSPAIVGYHITIYLLKRTSEVLIADTPKPLSKDTKPPSE